jgi:hypothetical protein
LGAEGCVPIVLTRISLPESPHRKKLYEGDVASEWPLDPAIEQVTET